jgi:hypothetical protein
MRRFLFFDHDTDEKPLRRWGESRVRRGDSIETPSDHISIVISIGNENNTAPANPRTICSLGIGAAVR